MVDEAELVRRKALTFEEAEGLAELPRQLQRDEMPNTLRAQLFRTVVQSVEADAMNERFAFSIGPLWRHVFTSLDVNYFGIVAIQHADNKQVCLAKLKAIFSAGSANEVYGLLQAILRSARRDNLAKAMARLLEEGRSAYRLLDGDTLVPFGSTQEAMVLAAALSDSKTAGQSGANTHLRESARNLSEGAYADSIRESIHAVESLLRSLTGTTKVSDALSELAKKRPLHPALSNGIKQLYGFASDEPGVRHPLLEKGDAAVTEEDAMLMLGTCASLVTYFTRSFPKS